MIDIESADLVATRNNPNPLNKIPALEPNWPTNHRIKIIYEYLIKLANRNDLMPEAGTESFIRIALADGITEAMLLIMYEQRAKTIASKC